MLKMKSAGSSVISLVMGRTPIPDPDVLELFMRAKKTFRYGQDLHCSRLSFILYLGINAMNLNELHSIPDILKHS